MKKPISLHDFKNWLSNQPDMTEFFNIGATQEDEPERKYQKYIGCEVVAKVSPQKLLEKIETEESDPESLIEEFVADGGTVSDVEGKTVIINTDSGTFSLPRFCVTLRK
jgi:hypothetical protein